MNREQFSVKYGEYLSLFNEYAKNSMTNVGAAEKLAEAMKYSMFVGGKRIRPIILLAMCDRFGVSRDVSMPFALALECIHTYSLIHDDLPALDGDVIRRGHPTNHVKYGEATAILAGDALLNFAYETLFSVCKDENAVCAASYMAKCAGAHGMLSGQELDMESENSEEISLEKLNRIYGLKTAKLLTCPIACAFILSGKDFKIAEDFGNKFGLLFQYADDYKDVYATAETLGKSIGKDEEDGKLTAYKIFGENLKRVICELKDELISLSASIDESGFLRNVMETVAEI